MVVWRPHLAGPQKPHGRKAFGRLKPLEAFFSTDVSLSASPADFAEFLKTDGTFWSKLAKDSGAKIE